MFQNGGTLVMNRILLFVNNIAVISIASSYKQLITTVLLTHSTNDPNMIEFHKSHCAYA